MGVLQRFEQRLEEMVSGAFARVFRSAVQPVEIASALQREQDNSSQILSRNRRLAPNTFHVELSPTDYERLEGYGSTLSHELAQMLREHADEQGYMLSGSVSIGLEAAEDLGTGRFRVRSKALAGVASQGGSVTDSAVRRAGVVLEVNGMKHPLDPPGVVVGRGSEADLRISDPGVSRRHVEIRVSPGEQTPRVTVVDLGSTNGVKVNGSRVDQTDLDDDATLTIGNTTMRVRFVSHGDGG